ncbi:transglutaminase-like protein [Sinomonas cellulolyticus]|uniref:Transglutaminase family protein n=1 Tax=Sinomonas cellulolyticus TaxID=2801916 RepID=A0ABS1K1F5_9MICC|nr:MULTISPECIES: transglutaminase family protein [Sinomonas]MBL0705308.1 transglutaminase family protein [Sinomonas cellulolyticus]GHG40458.1 transglutaminase-like protein [Sinomonas sp. KCTC 49339]
MTRLKIHHRTAYRYNKRVTLSYNEARMTPLTEPQQVVLESQVRVAPTQAAVSSYKDYWGSRVTAFDMQIPHEYLEVVSSTTVEVHRVERVPVEGEVVPWERLRSPEVEDQFSDWLPQSRLSGPGNEVLGLVPGLVEGKDPNQAAHAVFDWMAGEMRYMPGSTAVTTDAEQAWNQRQGVCQDLAHLAIGSLRSLGIPARYISGYLHPRSSAGIGEVVAGQSHAWLEWWDGEWRSWDPTNHKPAGDFHVTVARGRDYRDVPPLKGVLSGGGGSHLEVSVEITRLA